MVGLAHVAWDHVRMEDLMMAIIACTCSCVIVGFIDTRNCVRSVQNATRMRLLVVGIVNL